MAMIGGSVEVSENESHSGSGLALALYEARKAASSTLLSNLDPVAKLAELPRLSEPGMEAAKTATIAGLKKARLDLLRGLADDANLLGPVLIDYIQAHAEVSLAGVVATVETSASLGRAPDPLTPNAPIKGPLSPVSLPVTGDDGATILGVQ